jgi:hypothetical protein
LVGRHRRMACVVSGPMIAPDDRTGEHVAG